MKKYPEHIAIILDGNRRYGQKIGDRLEGHVHGAKKAEDLISWCNDLKIKELTLYTFSLDNFKRSALEKKALFDLFRKNIERLKKDKNLYEKKNIKVCFAGRISLFPKDIYDAMQEIMQKTKENKGLRVNLAMAYSSKAEIVDAMRELAQSIKDKKISEKDIDEAAIDRHLYISNPIDIFIRPGGEKRLSDFLLWQSAYSELFFLDKLWPEFEKQDLLEIMGEYSKRERRFGK